MFDFNWGTHCAASRELCLNFSLRRTQSNSDTEIKHVEEHLRREQEKIENLIAVSMSCLDDVSYTNLKFTASRATSISHLFHDQQLENLHKDNFDKKLMAKIKFRH